MSFWIELHCDLLRDGRDARKPTMLGCHTQRNDSHGSKARTKEGANIVMTELQRSALKAGWKRTTHGWACPHCAARAKGGSDA